MIFRARNLAFFLLAATIVLAEDPSKSAESDVIGPKQPKDIQPIPSSTSSPVTPSSTPAANVTTPKPVTTTSTTTAVPSTTTTSTVAPTTTTTTTSTAAPTPSTTKVPSSTTTIKPSPSPATNSSWIVSGTNGTVCIVANMVIKISVPYKTLENKTVDAPFNIEKVQNASASGTCVAPNTQSLVLSWPNVNTTFHFSLNTSSKIYSLSSIDIEIAVNNLTFPNNTMMNVTEVQLSYKSEVFSVPQNNSYMCSTMSPLNLNGTTVPLTNTTVNGKLTVSNVHVQAFGTDSNGKYRAPMDCASTETPDIVPIAVGLILAGLVVIVLIAYLVGRKRAQARGYLSM